MKSSKITQSWSEDVRVWKGDRANVHDFWRIRKFILIHKQRKRQLQFTTDPAVPKHLHCSLTNYCYAYYLQTWVDASHISFLCNKKKNFFALTKRKSDAGVLVDLKIFDKIPTTLRLNFSLECQKLIDEFSSIKSDN